MHKNILSMMMSEDSTFTWEELYFKMPVFLRNFYIAEMSKMIQRKNQSITKPMQDLKKGSIPKEVRQAMSRGQPNR